MSKTGEVLLKAEEMTKKFGGLIAVDKLNLEVKEGAIHSIIGPNGAGKTTVFNCIMEFYTPDGGAIWFAGERIDGVSPDRVAEAHLSEHPLVPKPDRHREHPGGDAYSPQVDVVWGRIQHQGHATG
jgi:ABC-type multidrug transport system ATPase subunit